MRISRATMKMKKLESIAEMTFKQELDGSDSSSSFGSGSLDSAIGSSEESPKSSSGLQSGKNPNKLVHSPTISMTQKVNFTAQNKQLKDEVASDVEGVLRANSDIFQGHIDLGLAGNRLSDSSFSSEF